MVHYGSFDEAMNRKISDITERLKNARSKYLEGLKNDRQAAIYDLIKVYSIHGGILHQRLANLCDLDRKSLRPYIKKLFEKNLIKKNEQGLYESLEESFKDPLETASEFGQVVAFQLLGADRPLVLNNDIDHQIFSIDQKRVVTYDFSQYRKYIEPKFSEKDKLKELIFEFSNRIGSFIVYLLIFAMNPSTHPFSLSDKQIDPLVQEIVKRGISQIIPALVWRFRDFLYKSNHGYSYRDSKIGLIKKKPRYLFDHTFSLSLIESFTLIYPLMSYEFERIMPTRYMFKEILTEWPSVVESRKKFMKLFHERLKRQEGCKHQYGKPVKTLYGFVGQQCRICQHIRKVKKSDLSRIKNKKK